MMMNSAQTSLRIFTIFHPGVHYHSPTPGFCVSSFYQFPSCVTIIIKTPFDREGGAPAPPRRSEARARTAVKDAERGTSGAPRSGLDPRRPPEVRLLFEGSKRIAFAS